MHIGNNTVLYIQKLAMRIDLLLCSYYIIIIVIIINRKGRRKLLEVMDMFVT